MARLNGLTSNFNHHFETKNVFICEDWFGREGDHEFEWIRKWSLCCSFEEIWRWEWMDLEVKCVKVNEWFDWCDTFDSHPNPSYECITTKSRREKKKKDPAYICIRILNCDLPQMKGKIRTSILLHSRYQRVSKFLNWSWIFQCSVIYTAS